MRLNKKLILLTYFGDDELERFFAERYKHILQGHDTDTNN